MPVDQPLHVAFLDVARGLHLQAEPVSHFSEQVAVAPWVDLLFEQEAEALVLDGDVEHVGFRRRSHDEQRNQTQVLA